MTVAAVRNLEAEAIGYCVSGWMPPKWASEITNGVRPEGVEAAREYLRLFLGSILHAEGFILQSV